VRRARQCPQAANRSCNAKLRYRVSCLEVPWLVFIEKIPNMGVQKSTPALGPMAIPIH
jgi:hypothetical protein